MVIGFAIPSARAGCKEAPAKAGQAARQSSSVGDAARPRYPRVGDDEHEQAIGVVNEFRGRIAGLQSTRGRKQAKANPSFLPLQDGLAALEESLDKRENRMVLDAWPRYKSELVAAKKAVSALKDSPATTQKTRTRR